MNDQIENKAEGETWAARVSALSGSYWETYNDQNKNPVIFWDFFPARKGTERFDVITLPDGYEQKLQRFITDAGLQDIVHLDLNETRHDGWLARLIIRADTSEAMEQKLAHLESRKDALQTLMRDVILNASPDAFSLDVFKYTMRDAIEWAERQGITNRQDAIQKHQKEIVQCDPDMPILHGLVELCAQFTTYADYITSLIQRERAATGSDKAVISGAIDRLGKKKPMIASWIDQQRAAANAQITHADPSLKSVTPVRRNPAEPDGTNHAVG